MRRYRNDSQRLATTPYSVRHSVTPDDDPSWQAYSDTILEFRSQPQVSIDLRRPLQPDDQRRIEALGLGASFVVLTACNPRGGTTDASTNERATSILQAQLLASGRSIVPVDGLSRDRRHREPGFALAMPVEEARALAMSIGQSAYFTYREGSFQLMGALVDIGPTPLPRELDEPPACT